MIPQLTICQDVFLRYIPELSRAALQCSNMVLLRPLCTSTRAGTTGTTWVFVFFAAMSRNMIPLVIDHSNPKSPCLICKVIKIAKLYHSHTIAMSDYWRDPDIYPKDGIDDLSGLVFLAWSGPPYIWIWITSIKESTLFFWHAMHPFLGWSSRCSWFQVQWCPFHIISSYFTIPFTWPIVQSGEAPCLAGENRQVFDFQTLPQVWRARAPMQKASQNIPKDWCVFSMELLEGLPYFTLAPKYSSDPHCFLAGALTKRHLHKDRLPEFIVD